MASVHEQQPEAEIVNPATGAVLRHLPMAGAAEVDEAVRLARAAQPGWATMPLRERAGVLFRLAALIEERVDELALLETRNVGKPLGDARGEVGMAAETFRYYAGAVDKHFGESIPVDGGIDVTFREPLGVVGVIVPWNFPFAITAWNVAPALAAGNAVVVKPSELTPLTALELPALAAQAGLPDGVLQVVVGTGAGAGARLVEHEHIAKIAFTGSTAVGKGIMAAAAPTLKRLTLELGGKAANIVFADADIQAAATSAVPAAYGNAGQDCCSRARILVQRGVLEEFTEAFTKALGDWTVGDPEDLATDMGPLVSERHRARVASFLDDAPEPIHRGTVPAGDGFWFPPTVLALPTPDARVAREEVFGPVVAVIPFEDEADAVTIANDSPYGLSGSIWTVDGSRALRMARAVQAGVLSVNSNSSVRVSTPFGGVKQSGIGRELGMHALDAYTDIKNVFISTG
ncbi:aldehyde dehydrogenase family protein [Actinomycetes bacterium KLBMP 9759]